MKRAKSVTSGLVGEADLASINLANIRKSPAVSVGLVSQLNLKQSCWKSGLTVVNHAQILLFCRAVQVVGPREIVALPNVQVLKFTFSGLTASLRLKRKTTLTAKDIHAQLAVQLPHFRQGAQKTVSGRVYCLHCPKDHVDGWLATAEVRRVFNVIEHQRRSMQKVDHRFDHERVIW
jgi:hypothetical protein